MGQPIVVVDAFTDRPFAGNPAAVCLLPRPAEPRWMQAVAREMNLSETAFLVREPDGFALRWFTPASEVALCGHATLASAHHLWESGALPSNAPARFATRSGPLTARRRGAWIEMDFPAKPAAAADPPPAVGGALRAAVRGFAVSEFDALVELASDVEVRGLAPDLALVAALPYRGVIVTARADAPGHDVVSRFFAPRVGVPEDPVTGSAHCVLGPYWATKLGRGDFVAYQASARGGVVRVGVRGDRVMLGGQAVTVWRGELVPGPEGGSGPEMKAPAPRGAGAGEAA
jgi:predicted PhzF superfamily epimerase YddE/YHI9